MRTGSRPAARALMLTTAALVVAILVTGVGSRVASAPADSLSIIRGVPERATPGRLVGAQYQPWRGPGAVRLSAAGLRYAATQQRQISPRWDSSSLAELGRLTLVAEGPRPGAALLELAASQGRSDARTRTDLSAALLARASERGAGSVVELSSRALAWAVRALEIEPGSRPALFNRAVALENLTLYEQARAAWSDYLVVERDPAWLTEARLHLSRLPPTAIRLRRLQTLQAPESPDVIHLAEEFPTAAEDLVATEVYREWAESVVAGRCDAADASLVRVQQVLSGVAGSRVSQWLVLEDLAKAQGQCDSPETRALAAGVDAFARGRRAFDSEQTSASIPYFVTAASILHDAVPALASTASLQGIFARYRAGLATDASGELAAWLAENGDLTADDLKLRCYWYLGIIAGAQADYGAMLSNYQTALDLASTLQHRDYIATLHQLLADAANLLGDQPSAWRHLMDALPGTASGWIPQRRYTTLWTLAHAAEQAALPEVSAEAYREILTMQPLWPRIAAYTSTAFELATIYVQLARLNDAITLVRTARARIQELTDPAFRNLTEANLLLAEGDVLAASGDAKAVDAYQAADALYSKAGTVVMRSTVQLKIARTLRQKGRLDAAWDTLSGALTLADTAQQTTLQSQVAPLRGKLWPVYEEGIEIALARGEPMRALAMARRGTGGAELVDANNRSLAGAGSANRVVLRFVTLPERTVVWVIAHDRTECVELAVPIDELDRLSYVVDRALEVDRADVAGDALAQLYRVLVLPLRAKLADAKRLVIIPDGPLHRVPFAALRAESGRYLIEAYELSLAYDELPRATGGGIGAGQRTALVVGVDRGIDVDGTRLAPLPAAVAEARDIAAMYPGPDVLLSAAATAEEFAHRAPHADVVHLAAHAIVSDEQPSLARFVFAPQAGRPSVVFGHEIARWHFPRTGLVVLAGCRTAGGLIYRGEGPLSLARPFLQAGASAVIGTLWPLDNQWSQQAFVELHGELRASGDVVASLSAVLRRRAIQGEPFTQWAGLTALTLLSPS